METNDVSFYKLPKTRTVLWDHASKGKSTEICFPYYQKPKIYIKERLLQCASCWLQSQGSTQASCNFLGSVTEGPTTLGIIINCNEFIEKKNRLARNAELIIPAKVSRKTRETLLWNVEDYHSDMNEILTYCQNMIHLDLKKLYAVRITSSLFGIDCNIKVEMSALSVSFLATPINPISIHSHIPEAALKNKGNSECSGYLALNEDKKLVHLLENHPDLSVLPLVGVWVSGVPSVVYPLVWAACVRYVSDPSFDNRLCLPPLPFALLLYLPSFSQPQFFDCLTSQQDWPTFTHFEGSASTTLPKVPVTDSKMLSVEVHEKMQSVFEKADHLIERRKFPSGPDVIITNACDVPMPFRNWPHEPKIISPEHQVPDLSMESDFGSECAIDSGFHGGYKNLQEKYFSREKSKQENMINPWTNRMYFGNNYDSVNTNAAGNNCINYRQSFPRAFANDSLLHYKLLNATNSTTRMKTDVFEENFPKCFPSMPKGSNYLSSHMECHTGLEEHNNPKYEASASNMISENTNRVTDDHFHVQGSCNMSEIENVSLNVYDNSSSYLTKKPCLKKTKDVRSNLQSNTRYDKQLPQFSNKSKIPIRAKSTTGAVSIKINNKKKKHSKITLNDENSSACFTKVDTNPTESSGEIAHLLRTHNEVLFSVQDVLTKLAQEVSNPMTTENIDNSNEIKDKPNFECCEQNSSLDAHPNLSSSQLLIQQADHIASNNITSSNPRDFDKGLAGSFSSGNVPFADVSMPLVSKTTQTAKKKADLSKEYNNDRSTNNNGNLSETKRKTIVNIAESERNVEDFNSKRSVATMTSLVSLSESQRNVGDIKEAFNSEQSSSKDKVRNSLPIEGLEVNEHHKHCTVDSFDCKVLPSISRISSQIGASDSDFYRRSEISTFGCGFVDPNEISLSVSLHEVNLEVNDSDICCNSENIPQVEVPSHLSACNSKHCTCGHQCCLESDLIAKQNVAEVSVSSQRNDSVHQQSEIFFTSQKSVFTHQSNQSLRHPTEFSRTRKKKCSCCNEHPCKDKAAEKQGGGGTILSFRQSCVVTKYQEYSFSRKDFNGEIHNKSSLDSKNYSKQETCESQFPNMTKYGLPAPFMYSKIEDYFKRYGLIPDDAYKLSGVVEKLQKNPMIDCSHANVNKAQQHTK